MDSLPEDDLWNIKTCYKGKVLIVNLGVDFVHLACYNKIEFTSSCHYIHFKVHKMDIYWKLDSELFLTGYYLRQWFKGYN